MAVLTVSSAEGFVGANHPTSADSLNRLTLGEHDSSGNHAATSFPNFRCHLNGTNQAVSTDGTTNFKFTAKAFDSNSALDSTNWCYNVPKSGKYFMSFSVYASGVSTDGVSSAQLILGTTVAVVAQGGMYYGNTSTARRHFKLSAIMNLNSTDRVFPFVSFGTASTIVITGASGYSYFSGAYLGV